MTMHEASKPNHQQEPPGSQVVNVGFKERVFRQTLLQEKSSAACHVSSISEPSLGVSSN